MKKLILFLGLFILLTTTGCSSKNYDINYIEDSEHSFSNNYTYKFVGESDHFYFETGKVYYNGDERELLISNFKIKDNIKSDASFKINLYFNDKLLYGDVDKTDKLSKKDFEGIVIAEHGTLGKKDSNGNVIGESDSFLETTKDTFKNSIKLQADYCVNNKCSTETFKLSYLD